MKRDGDNELWVTKDLEGADVVYLKVLTTHSSGKIKESHEKSRDICKVAEIPVGHKSGAVPLH
jgi:hypothetical protein